MDSGQHNEAIDVPRGRVNQSACFRHIIKWNGGIHVPRGRERHMFPGGNTSKGFFSFYKNILRQEDARRIFILKGGPGTGKSTYMKKIAGEMQERGHDVEYMHCSSDNNSIDGVVIPGIGVALLDGTAPHICDPLNPGAVDEIINLGGFWKEEGLVKSRQKILEIRGRIGIVFARAYRHLKAAGHLYEDSAAIYGLAVNEAEINRLAEKFKNELFYGVPLSGKTGKQRCLFAGAITPDGLKNYLDSLLTAKDVYVLEGFPGAGTERVLERIKAAALERGVDVEAYYCAFNPEKLEHLILPGLDAAFTTVNSYHNTDACAFRRVDFGDMLDKSIIASYRHELEYDLQEFDRLLKGAVDIIHGAKALHDELESCYIPNMDFDALRANREETMKRILSYAAIPL